MPLDMDMELALALKFEEESNGVDPPYWMGMDTDLDAALAMSLQQEGHSSTNDARGAYQPFGHEIALPAQATETNELFFGLDNTQDDHQMALTQAKIEVEAATSSSVQGKAWNFVRAALEEYQNIVASEQATKVADVLALDTMGVDAMMINVERLMEIQALFEPLHHPWEAQSVYKRNISVDIGYHFTRHDNLKHILANGLLTKADRDRLGVTGNYNGATWGDGVYTANNPFDFCNFGDTGLLVARLKLTTAEARPGGQGFVGDTAIANRGSRNEMVILRQSYQCAPLLRFRTPTKPDGDVDGAIWYAHQRLQRIVDAFFNNGAKTDVNIVHRPAWNTNQPAPARNASQPDPALKTMKTMPPTTFASPSKQSLSPGVARCDWYQDYKRRHYGATKDAKRELKHSPCQSETYRRDAVNGGGGNAEEIMRVMRYSKDKLACDKFDTFVIVCAFNGASGKTTSHESTDIRLRYCIEYMPDTPAHHVLLEGLKQGFQIGVIDQTSWKLLPHRTSPYLSYKNDPRTCVEALQKLGIPCRALDEALKEPPEEWKTCRRMETDSSKPLEAVVTNGKTEQDEHAACTGEAGEGQQATKATGATKSERPNTRKNSREEEADKQKLQIALLSCCP